MASLLAQEKEIGGVTGVLPATPPTRAEEEESRETCIAAA
jgi:hypothetical protein